jgi:hypothetical protein
MLFREIIVYSENHRKFINIFCEQNSEYFNVKSGDMYMGTSVLWGHAVALLVKALCYKLEGRRFESRIRWIFSIYLVLAAALWPWGRLSLCQKRAPGMFLGVKCGRRVGLTTLPPSLSWISENMGASNSRNSKGLHGLYMDNCTFYICA